MGMRPQQDIKHTQTMNMEIMRTLLLIFQLPRDGLVETDPFMIPSMPSFCQNFLGPGKNTRYSHATNEFFKRDHNPASINAPHAVSLNNPVDMEK
jgi:hypothetical protein